MSIKKKSKVSDGITLRRTIRTHSKLICSDCQYIDNDRVCFVCNKLDPMGKRSKYMYVPS